MDGSIAGHSDALTFAEDTIFGSLIVQRHVIQSSRLLK